MVPNLDPRRLPTQGKCKWDLNNFIDYGTRFSRKICHILASFRFQESGWYLTEDTSWSQMEAQPGKSTLHLPDYCIQSIWIRYKNYSDCPIASHCWPTFYSSSWKHTFPILHLSFPLLIHPYDSLFNHFPGNSWISHLVLCQCFHYNPKCRN